MADGPRTPTRSPLVERFVIGFDIQGFSVRSTRRQQLLQRDLDDILVLAAAAAGLDRREWILQPTGDGELAIVPPDVDLALVVGRFVTELDGLLADRNEDRAGEMQLRLRLAMHIDTLILSPSSHAGPALVVVTHLLDSAPVRKALRSAPDARLALIVSDAVYRKVGLAGLGGVRPEQFAPVQVTLPGKGFDEIAHVHIPGHDMRTFPTDAGDELDESDDPPVSPPTERIPGMHIGGPVYGDVIDGVKHGGNSYDFGPGDDDR